MSDTEDKSQKTEEPSYRKLEKAKEEGNVFTSKEVSAFLSLFIMSLSILIVGGFFSKALGEKLAKFITNPYEIIATVGKNSGSKPGNILVILQDLILDILPFVVVPPLIMMVISIFSLLAQHGIIYSTDIIQPKLERISIIAGFKRIFSLSAIVELLKGIIKILVVAIIIYSAIKGNISHLIQSYQFTVLGSMSLLMASLAKLFIGICSFMFFLAIGDYLYQRYAYINKLKMTKKEVKDEHKEQEGSPEVKSKLKSMRAKMSKRRVMAAVPNADVVVTNPTHYSVALEFKPEKMDTPIVVAKGQDDIALLIRDIARKNNIPIVENPPLARALFAEVEPGMKIKEKHYKAVADIILYIMKMKRR
jgi:flagellar biosynthetic protein FlhB